MTSKVIEKKQCPNCASKGGDKNEDNLAVYDDGHTYCYKCRKATSVPRNNTIGGVKSKQPTDDGWQENYRGEFYTLTDRRITSDTLEKYKVRAEKDGKGNIIKHHYPYHDQKGEVVGIKTRIVDGKKFFGSGNTSSGNKLFGQHLFQGGRKIVTICEGELDAMSAYEMFGRQYTFVSINNGAGGLDNIKANLEWIDSFETVVLCMDNDNAGRDFTRKVAPLIGPNKCKIMTLEKHKDPSDYLVSGDDTRFKDEFWRAKPYIVSGVASVEDMRLALMDYKDTELIPLPDSFGNLQEMTRGGLARGEMTSIIAHTSIGKTTILNELIYHFAMNTNEKIGCFMVEDRIDETLRKVVSVYQETNLQLLKPDEIDVDNVMDDAVKIGFGSRIQLYDDGGGSIDLDEMFSKIRYFVKGLGCSVILVDPLHTAIKNLSNENIEEVMDRFIVPIQGSLMMVVTHTKSVSMT